MSPLLSTQTINTFATMKLLLVSALLLVVSTINTFADQPNICNHLQHIYDVSGNDLKPGTPYYITSAIWGAGGGGLFPLRRPRICPRCRWCCPLNVAQKSSDLDNGHPVFLSPSNSSIEVLHLLTDLKIEFTAPAPGNLPGDMAFWDFVGKKMIGATKAECSVTSEWSPDGRYFMTATTAPRLQIDNRIRIFHHNGSIYFEKNFDKLYQADWKPESAQRFRDITDLVNSVNSLKIEETGRQAQDPKMSRASTKAPANIIQKPAAYCPPHAKGVAAAKAELFGESASSEQLSKNALRNKKRREKKKAGEGGAAAEDN